MTLLAAALAASLEVRHVSVPAGTGGAAVRIECPVGQTTRIVFPDRLVSLTASAGAQEALGLVPLASRPLGILSVTPPAHPAQGRVRVSAPSGSLTVVLQTVPKGRGSEIQLVRETPVAPPEPAPAATPAHPELVPEAAAAPGEHLEVGASQQPSAEPEPSVPPEADGERVSPLSTLAVAPSPAPIGLASDAGELVRATPVRIGRREGRPGQREMVLDDALKGESFVWLRFTLKKGAKRQVTRVWWEDGTIESFEQEPSGEDLKLRVRLPRASVKGGSRLNVTVSGEGEYRFALKDSSFVSLLKGLFY